jgi:hypothetical protein
MVNLPKRPQTAQKSLRHYGIFQHYRPRYFLQLLSAFGVALAHSMYCAATRANTTASLGVNRLIFRGSLFTVRVSQIPEGSARNANHCHC